MRSTRKSKLSLALTALLTGVLMACLAAPVTAATESQPARGVVGQYDAAHEMTINGTVQQVITKRTVGSPAGMHLKISGTNGVVDAHVGPFLTKSMLQAVHTGLPLQVVGSMVTIRGKQVLLVRQMIYGGQTVIVRNSQGLLHRPAETPSSLAKKNARFGFKGGAQ